MRKFVVKKTMNGLDVFFTSFFAAEIALFRHGFCFTFRLPINSYKEEHKKRIQGLRYKETNTNLIELHCILIRD